MDLDVATSFFDGLVATDAYTGTSLFTGQLDLYDAAIRDSPTGWRRTISAAVITKPTRGVLSVAGAQFLTGRIVFDTFQSDIIRQHLLLQPCDGLFEGGSSASFLTPGSPRTPFYAALALRKEMKEEGVSSQFFNLYGIYTALTEDFPRDYLIKDSTGNFYRIQNVEIQSGQLKTFVAGGIGQALTSVDYSVLGAYNSTTDSETWVTTEGVSAFVERFQDNYRYTQASAEKFKPGDQVITVSASVIVAPKAGDKITVGSSVSTVIGAASDGYGSWELHTRVRL